MSITQQQMIEDISTHCISVRMRLLNRKVGSVYDLALRPHGIKASQLNILVAVATFGEVTSRQLCRMLHMDTSTFSRSVSRLKKNHWLRIEPSGEGKILKIAVTRLGFEKIEQVYPSWQKAQEEVKKILGQPAVNMLVTAGNQHMMGRIAP